MFFSKQALIGLAVGVLAGWLVFGVLIRQTPTVNLAGVGGGIAEEKDCTVKNTELTVQGTSMGKLLPAGSKVKVAENYYTCNDAEKNDIVLYDYPGSEVPIAKRIVGVPGDEFGLMEDKSSSGWNILINGEIAETSDGKPYLLGDRAYRVLSLYVKDYKGVIPANAYLILGDLPGGSLDSSEFGLVGRDDFLGKIAP